MTLVHANPATLDSYADPDATVVAWCERGSAAIEQAANLADARDIRDWADTVEHASKVRDLNHETIIIASSLKIRAERRIGQLVRDGQERGEINRGGRPEKLSSARSVSDLGLSHNQAAEAKRLAEPDDDDFEQAMAQAAAATRQKAGVSRRAVLSKIDQQEREAVEQREWVASLGDDPDPAATRLRGVAHRAVLSLTDGVDRLARQISPDDLVAALASYPERQSHVRDQIVADIRRAADVVTRYEEALR